MIVEALTWLTTPAPDWARKLGYLRELIAIEARYRRCQPVWAPHLDATCAAIRDAMNRCARRRQALIYGSGPLLDIPLQDLADGFETVTLVDAAHLRTTRRAAGRFANVRLVEADIAGVAAGLLLGVAKGADQLPRPTPPAVGEYGPADLVASVNLLTQLPVVPLAFLGRQFDAPAEALDDYARIVMQAHLDHLASFDAVRCLIAETESRHIGRDDAVSESSDPLRGITLPRPDRTWDWTVAPVGEVSPSFAVRNRVAAITTMPQRNNSATKRRAASP